MAEGGLQCDNDAAQGCRGGITALEPSPCAVAGLLQLSLPSVTEEQPRAVTALFCSQGDVCRAPRSASATDGLSAASYLDYPTHKPFINSDLLRSPQKPVVPYPESNSRGNRHRVIESLNGLG